jgi:hypothetical protein
MRCPNNGTKADRHPTYNRKGFLMADDRKKRGGADRTRVNLQEPYEVDYWCKQFLCTTGELKEAVDAVGVLAKNVRIYIASHKPTATD